MSVDSSHQPQRSEPSRVQQSSIWVPHALLAALNEFARQRRGGIIKNRSDAAAAIVWFMLEGNDLRADASVRAVPAPAGSSVLNMRVPASMAQRLAQRSADGNVLHAARDLLMLWLTGEPQKEKTQPVDSAGLNRRDERQESGTMAAEAKVSRREMAYGPDNETAEFVFVTPDMARAWLELNKNNRLLNKRRVEALVVAIEEQRFRVTNQGIAFSAGGVLVDGQHRLNAIISAGKGAWLLVVRGLVDRATDAIDRGQSRSVCQILRRDDEIPRAGVVAAWSNVDYQVRRGVRRISDPAQVRAYYTQNQGAVEWALKRFADKAPFKAAALGAALILAYRTDAKQVDQFAELLVSGEGLSRGMPVYELRQFIVSNPSPGGSDASHDLALKVLRAVMGHLRGERIQALHASVAARDFFLKANPTV